MSSLAEVLANGIGIERSFLCPVHGDSTPSASVNTVKMVWCCYACGAHGKVGGEDLLAEIDFYQVRKQILKQASGADPYPESWLNVYDAPSHPYWKSRFSDAAVSHFRLGYDYGTQCATTPVRAVDGAVLGVTRRRLDGAGSRYHYPWGVDVSRLLFNFDGADAPVVVLTEGATDAIAAWEAGFDALALYGNQLRKPQVALLRRYDPMGIICAFDMDKAGAEAHRSVWGQLPEYPITRATWPARLGKDLSAMSVKQRAEILQKELDLFGPSGVASPACSMSTSA